MKMKKCLAIILALVMALGCMSFTAFAADPQVLTGFAGGDGSAESPYQIATLAELENLADIVNGGNTCADTYFVLTADIGTAETPFTKVIGYSNSGVPFSGNFDGKNHTVTLNINNGNERFTGLFGRCGGAAIANVNTAGSVTGADAIGSICGWAEGCTISNCHNSATITTLSSNHGYVGGVCGYATNGTIVNCSNSGAVSGAETVGGVCGLSAVIANSYNTGAVSTSCRDAVIGGICGEIGYSGNYIINCYNAGEVSYVAGFGEPESLDGVCADENPNDPVINCYYDSSKNTSKAATGLTTEQIKGAANDETSLAYKLNNYKDESTGSYPEGWFTWIIDETTGLPMLAIPEEPEEDPSGVDLSMLTTGAKIQLGTQSGSPVEWVIGGDGTNGMSVPEGCIALVTSGLVASNVKFDLNESSNVYATSNLKTVVEGAVTFTTDEQAAIQERILAGNQTYGTDCDGVAGDSVTAKVWAPTTKDAYALNSADLSAVGSDYWLCSPGDFEFRAAFFTEYGYVYESGDYVANLYGVRAALYLDASYISDITAVEGKENTYTLSLTAPSTFLTTFTLNKDYNDKYTADAKSTKVNETVSFTITPVDANAPEFDPDTFSMEVTNGVGSAEVDLPDTDDITSVGDYWYEIEETAGTTAGVTYDDTTYYLHLIVSYKDGEFGFSSAAIRSSNEVTADENGEYPTDGKIDTVSNSYGEGTLTVAQTTTVNGEASDEDAFEVTVTFTAPAGTTVIGDITYGDDKTVTFENGVGTVVIDLKGGESVTFENIPDGVTYTVEQTGSNEDKGYTLDSVSFGDTGETGDDSVSDANVASGTIGDAADTVTISNSKTVPIDVGVILENGAFIVLALGAIAAGAWLIVSKRRKSVDAE